MSPLHAALKGLWAEPISRSKGWAWRLGPVAAQSPGGSAGTPDELVLEPGEMGCRDSTLHQVRQKGSLAQALCGAEPGFAIEAARIQAPGVPANAVAQPREGRGLWAFPSMPAVGAPARGSACGRCWGVRTQVALAGLCLDSHPGVWETAPHQRESS